MLIFRVIFFQASLEVQGGERGRGAVSWSDYDKTVEVRVLANQVVCVRIGEVEPGASSPMSKKPVELEGEKEGNQISTKKKVGAEK